MKNLLNLWRGRSLTSVSGRITILKSLALSKLVYNTSVLTFPLQFAASVKTAISEFVWNTKPKIKHTNLVPRVSHLTALGERGETLAHAGHVPL